MGAMIVPMTSRVSHTAPWRIQIEFLLPLLLLLLLCHQTAALATEEAGQERVTQLTDNTLSTGTQSTGTPSTDDPPHRPLMSLQGWDLTIRSLEDKLESDLKRVEEDAHQGSQGKTLTLVASKKNQTRLETRLDKDLGRIRTDVHNLVVAIEAAELELERLKTQMALEHLALKQRSAKMTTEKILDDLHRGKLGVKVDYVTGQLVRRRPIPGAAVNSNGIRGVAVNNNSTASAETMPNASSNDTSLEVSMGRESENNPPSHDDAITEEQALEDLIEAASKQKSPRKIVEGDLTGDDKVPQEDKDIVVNDDNLKWRVKEEMESLRSGADPAILSIDLELLLDIVKLAMTAAFFGLAAVFLGLPPTAGFLFGGMLIGPSCLDMIGAIHQVQTLAQFGCIFLLFEQGLLYSQTYSGAAVLGSALATGRTEDIPADSIASTPKTTEKLLSRKGRHVRKAKAVSPQASSPTLASASVDTSHDPNIVGTIVLILLIFTALAIVVLTDVVSSVQEAVVVACSIAICSTTIVSENLHAAHIANSEWGKGVLKMIAMHDLFMVPMLALPELIAFLSKLGGDGNDDDDNTLEEDPISFQGVSIRMALVAVFLAISTFAAKHIIGAANLAQARMMGAKGELFTLSVVAYALLIASTAEQLKLSIEVGATLAGIILMKSPYVPKVLASIQPITSVFGGMYLTSLGMIISPSFVGNEAYAIIELVCLIGMFKMVLVSTVLNRFFDYGITACLAVGSAMAQISETSLLVLAKAQRLGLVSRKTYLLLIPTTCIMLTLAPFSAAHLRRLKMQEVSGNDDGKIPHYLCFLKHLGILRQPHFTPTLSQSSEELEEGRDFTHRT